MLQFFKVNVILIGLLNHNMQQPLPLRNPLNTATVQLDNYW